MGAAFTGGSQKACEPRWAFITSPLTLSKYGQKQLKEKVCLGSWLGMQPTEAGEPGAAGHFVSEQREMMQAFSPLSTCYLLFISCCHCGTQAHAVAPSTVRVGLPSSDKSLWKHLHRHAQRCVSEDTAIWWTTKVRHHGVFPLCPWDISELLHHCSRRVPLLPLGSTTGLRPLILLVKDTSCGPHFPAPGPTGQ